MLAALCIAKLFGVDGKVDIYPLFETETALEHGDRFLDALLAEPAYRAYARARGCDAHPRQQLADRLRSRIYARRGIMPRKRPFTRSSRAA